MEALQSVDIRGDASEEAERFSNIALLPEQVAAEPLYSENEHERPIQAEGGGNGDLVHTLSDGTTVRAKNLRGAIGAGCTYFAELEARDPVGFNALERQLENPGSVMERKRLQRTLESISKQAREHKSTSSSTKENDRRTPPRSKVELITAESPAPVATTVIIENGQQHDFHIAARVVSEKVVTSKGVMDSGVPEGLELEEVQEREVNRILDSLPRPDLRYATDTIVITSPERTALPTPDTSLLKPLHDAYEQTARGEASELTETSIVPSHHDVYGLIETDDQVNEQTEQIRQLKELFALPAFGEIAEDGPDVSLVEVVEVVGGGENGDEGNEEGDVLTLHDLDRLHNAMDNMLMVGLAQEEVGLLNVDEQEGSEQSFEPTYVEFGGGELELSSVDIEPESSELEVSAPEGIQALLMDLQVLLQSAELSQEIQAMGMSNLGVEATDEVAGAEIVDEVPIHEAGLSVTDTAIGTTVEVQAPELTPEIEAKVIEILEAIGYQQPQELLERYVVEYGSRLLLESLQQLFPMVDRLRYIADMEGFLEGTSGQGAGQIADDDDGRYASLRRLGSLICRAVAQSRIVGGVVQTV